MTADGVDLVALRLALDAFADDCVEHGDMTPGAKRMLDTILNKHLGADE